MDFSSETTVPSTVVDCMGLTADSYDSFYNMSESGSSQQTKPFSSYSPINTHSDHDQTDSDLSNQISADGWLAAEGIIDVQQVLLNEHAAASGLNSLAEASFSGGLFDSVGNSGASTEVDGDDLMSESEEEDETTPERLEVKLVMELSPKSLTAEQKKIRRRELNRLAAQRSRGKKRAASKAMNQEVKTLAEKNKELKATLEQLLKEKELYLVAVKKHFKYCVPTHKPASLPMYYHTSLSTQGTISGERRVV